MEKKGVMGVVLVLHDDVKWSDEEKRSWNTDGHFRQKALPSLFQQTHELLFSEQVRLYTMRSLRLSLSTTK